MDLDNFAGKWETERGMDAGARSGLGSGGVAGLVSSSEEMLPVRCLRLVKMNVFLNSWNRRWGRFALSSPNWSVALGSRWMELAGVETMLEVSEEECGGGGGRSTLA
jgi:hypothetical protein